MVQAPLAFRFVDGFITFNLEVSDKSIFGYKVKTSRKTLFSSSNFPELSVKGDKPILWVKN